MGFGRWTGFLLGLAASVALTVVLWVLGFPGFLLFLLFPFLWFPRSRSRPMATPACPSCGARVDRGFSFCPRCGAKV